MAIKIETSINNWSEFELARYVIKQHEFSEGAYSLKRIAQNVDTYLWANSDELDLGNYLNDKPKFFNYYLNLALHAVNANDAEARLNEAADDFYYSIEGVTRKNPGRG